MSTKRRISLRAIAGVAASKTVLVDVPCRGRIHSLTIQHGYASGTNTIAAAATNISQIRVKVNNRVQRTISGTQLRDMNLLNGVSFDCLGVPNTAPGVSFPIYFAEPWRQVPVEQDGLAWPCGLFETMQVEIDLAAASTPTIVVTAVVDDITVGRDQFSGIVKWFVQSIGASGTKFDVPIIERRDLLQQISLPQDSGGSNTMSAVTLRKNGQILHELSYSANFALLSNSQMFPTATGRTATIYDLVLDHDGLFASSVSLADSVETTLTIEAASAMSGTISAIIQRFGPPE